MSVTPEQMREAWQNSMVLLRLSVDSMLCGEEGEQVAEAIDEFGRDEACLTLAAMTALAASFALVIEAVTEHRPEGQIDINTLLADFGLEGAIRFDSQGGEQQ